MTKLRDLDPKIAKYLEKAGFDLEYETDRSQESKQNFRGTPLDVYTPWEFSAMEQNAELFRELYIKTISRDGKISESFSKDIITRLLRNFNLKDFLQAKISDEKTILDTLTITPEVVAAAKNTISRCKSPDLTDNCCDWLFSFFDGSRAAHQKHVSDILEKKNRLITLLEERCKVRHCEHSEAIQKKMD